MVSIRVVSLAAGAFVSHAVATNAMTPEFEVSLQTCNLNPGNCAFQVESLISTTLLDDDELDTLLSLFALSLVEQMQDDGTLGDGTIEGYSAALARIAARFEERGRTDAAASVVLLQNEFSFQERDVASFN